MIREFGINEFMLLFHGLGWTVGLALLSVAGSMVLALFGLVALISKSRALRILTMVWIQVVQGTPLLGQLFLVFFGLAFFGIDVPPLIAATVALSIYGSAFLAEIWQGAVDAIPKGQWESATVLGLNRRQQLRLIILPQAFRIAIAPTVGFVVQLTKHTSLASTIGFVELARQAQLVNGATFAPFTIYFFVCVLYFSICYPMTAWSRRLEAKFAITYR